MKIEGYDPAEAMKRARLIRPNTSVAKKARMEKAQKDLKRARDLFQKVESHQENRKAELAKEDAEKKALEAAHLKAITDKAQKEENDHKQRLVNESLRLSKAQAQQEIQSSKMKERKATAEAWIAEREAGHLAWRHLGNSYDVVNKRNNAHMKWQQSEPIRPTGHWFTPEWNIKEQYKMHYKEVL
ncbi:hypothetical protein [Vibrio lentus]|uniref:hypothetical protein n=1 Tax=Vibrio lentus TaxID=136468 RepID=UPI0010BD374F|nr:hypothetical protein [Vibrio lentus]TKG17736.1 hypothetical protein FCW05_12580 [Vibrio lentus]